MWWKNHIPWNKKKFRNWLEFEEDTLRCIVTWWSQHLNNFRLRDRCYCGWRHILRNTQVSIALHLYFTASRTWTVREPHAAREPRFGHPCYMLFLFYGAIVIEGLCDCPSMFILSYPWSPLMRTMTTFLQALHEMETKPHTELLEQLLCKSLHRKVISPTRHLHWEQATSWPSPKWRK